MPQVKFLCIGLWVLFYILPSNSKSAQADSVGIANFQWTPGHPVRSWLEGIGPQGRNPLYEGKISEPGGLTPLQKDKSILNIGLPSFVLEKKDTTGLTQSQSEKFPQLAVLDWLKTSQSEGAVEVWFRFLGSPSGDSHPVSVEKGVSELTRLLESSPGPPTPIKFSFSAGRQSSRNQTDSSRPWIVSLIIPPKITDPLLIQTCQFFDKWLNSLVILSESYNLYEKKILFECEFTLPTGEKNSDYRRKNSVKFTRLTLPLFDKDSYRFDVIQTELDLQSVSALSVLRRPNAGSENRAK